FALSDLNGTQVSDGFIQGRAFRTERNRALIKTDSNGNALEPIRVDGLLTNSLDHLVVSASRVEFNSRGEVIIAETSEFSPPKQINFITPGTENDRDGDRVIDLFEDNAPGLVDELLFGDIDDDGFFDADQDDVIAAPVQGSEGVAPPVEGVLLGGLPDPGTSAVIKVTRGSIVDSAAVISLDEADVGENGFQNLITIDTQGATEAEFRYIQRLPFRSFEKSFIVPNDGLPFLDTVTFTPETVDFPEGVKVEFMPGEALHTVVVTIQDNSPFDLNATIGLVSDPFTVALPDALAFDASPSFHTLAIRRADDELHVVDRLTNEVLQRRASQGTDSIAIASRRDVPVDVSIEAHPTLNFNEQDVVFLTGSDRDDVFTVELDALGQLSGGDSPRLSLSAAAGNDRLRIRGNGLQNLENVSLHGLEVLDVRGDGANQLVVSADLLRQITDSGNTLTVQADIDDSVILDGSFSIAETEVVDGELVRILTQDDVTLRSIGPSEWTNPVNALDVNGDGGVSPIDALSVINELTRGALLDNDGNLVPAGQEGAFQGRFVDVLARGFFSALDALVIINALARQQTTAEGEQFSEVKSDRHVVQLLDSALMRVAERKKDRKFADEIESGLEDPIASRPTETRQELRPSATPQSSPTTSASQSEFERNTDQTRAVDEFFRLLTEV
ncbi:MAG: dockerin type I domain-containing protein, partial [Planctomycetota bacterium]